MNAGLVLHRSREYASAGVGFGGALLKRPLFVLGMTWYRLRDML